MQTPLKTWQFRLGIALIALSMAGYLLQYVIFQDSNQLFVALLNDLSFVFLQVFVVTIVVDELLSRHEKQRRMEKLDMVIGSFFSEIGTELLRIFSDWDEVLGAIRQRLQLTMLWTEEQFDIVAASMLHHEYRVAPEAVHPQLLRCMLGAKHDFLLRLMENPNLLEHERFTPLLMSTFHLTEELLARRDPEALPESDIRHLAGDVDRVYGQLARFWLEYMKYLKGNYPYLFSLAVRMNPFDECASAEVHY